MTKATQHTPLHADLRAPITPDELIALCAERDALRAEVTTLRLALKTLSDVPHDYMIASVRELARAALARKG